MERSICYLKALLGANMTHFLITCGYLEMSHVDIKHDVMWHDERGWPCGLGIMLETITQRCTQLHTCFLHSMTQSATEQSQMSLSFIGSVINKQGRGGEWCKNELLKQHIENYPVKKQPCKLAGKEKDWWHRVCRMASMNDNSMCHCNYTFLPAIQWHSTCLKSMLLNKENICRNLGAIPGTSSLLLDS